MALVHVLTATPEDRCTVEALRSRAHRDIFGVHSLTEDPAEADVILFMEYFDEPFLDSLRRHPLVEQFRSKCFCISERDYTFPFLPGIYTSVPARWARHDRIRSGFYLVMHQNPYVRHLPLVGDEPYLFSFVGSFYTHPIRPRLLELEHHRGLVVDRSRAYKSPTAEEKAALQRDYADALRQSKFVLCPRGFAPVSSRLFETLRAGRVPVVIADDWSPMPGPEWDAFCIQVAERDVARIPRVLAEREGEAASMGAAARRAWEAWYSEEVSFHRIVEMCLDIKRRRRLPESVLRLTAWWQLLFQPYRFNYLRSRRGRLRQRSGASV